MSLVDLDKVAVYAAREQTEHSPIVQDYEFEVSSTSSKCQP